jgi:hypothetical protein
MLATFVNPSSATKRWKELQKLIKVTDDPGYSNSFASLGRLSSVSLPLMKSREQHCSQHGNHDCLGLSSAVTGNLGLPLFYPFLPYPSLHWPLRYTNTFFTPFYPNPILTLTHFYRYPCSTPTQFLLLPQIYSYSSPILPCLVLTPLRSYPLRSYSIPFLLIYTPTIVCHNNIIVLFVGCLYLYYY